MSLVMEEIQEALLELSRQEDDDVDCQKQANTWRNEQRLQSVYDINLPKRGFHRARRCIISRTKTEAIEPIHIIRFFIKNEIQAINA